MIKQQRLVTQYKIDIEMPDYKQKNHKDETEIRLSYIGIATITAFILSFLFYVILDSTQMLEKMDNMLVLFLSIFTVLVFTGTGLFMSHMFYNAWRDSPRRYRIKTDNEVNFMLKIKEDNIPLPASYFDEILSGKKENYTPP